MSSIISDLFFGSKQNILDNYLVNRHENQQQSSLHHHKQETVVFASFIELVIRIPALTEREESMMFKVEAEMGTKSDEGFIEVKPNERESEAIVLVLNELEKQDLNKYTNIKVTISEGKYSKIHGFIPIESIKNIASSFSNEKTIIVHMKGKKNFPFSSIQCTIRTEFPNNNVLNSQILRSMDKDHESYQRSKEQVSDQSSQIQVQLHHRQTAKRRGNQSSVNDQGRKYLQRQDNIVFEDKGSKKKSSGNIDKFQPAMTEFVKEIKSIQIQFNKVELLQSLQKQEENVRLKLGQRLFGLCETVEITQITKKGVNIELMSDNQVIGSIHLSPLLLTLQKISGELPIYSAQQQCLGTITVQSPNETSQKHTHSTIPKYTIVNHSSKQPQIDTKKQLVCLSIDRILVINSLNPLNSSSFLDSSQNDTYDFAKLEQSKLEVLVRINGVTSKFTDMVIHYNVDRDIIKIAELRRRQGFVCRYFEDCNEEMLSIEVQIFSAYRLISYSKASLSLEEKISHKFMSGDTSCPFFHSAIHLKTIRLEVQAELFQQHKINSIFNILQDLLSNRIILNRTDDSQIKSIMALHKKTTYIELKKLLSLLQSSSKQIKQFQQSQVKCVYSKQNPERNEAMIKLSYRLLEEFLYIDIKNQKVVRKEDFEKVIQFYKEDLEAVLEKDFEAFISQPIGKDNNILFIFFVAGFYFVNHHVQEPQQYKQEVKEQVQSPQKQPQHAQLIQTIKQVSVISQPSYLISKISITNAHLLNLGKAPNLTLNITKKVCYSNSNPEFVIQKEVSLLNPIQICHKSIAEDRVIVLAEFKPTRRQTLYELQPSGKCYAKITWGL